MAKPLCLTQLERPVQPAAPTFSPPPDAPFWLNPGRPATPASAPSAKGGGAAGGGPGGGEDGGDVAQQTRELLFGDADLDPKTGRGSNADIYGRMFNDLRENMSKDRAIQEVRQEQSEALARFTKALADDASRSPSSVAGLARGTPPSQAPDPGARASVTLGDVVTNAWNAPGILGSTLGETLAGFAMNVGSKALTGTPILGQVFTVFNTALKGYRGYQQTVENVARFNRVEDQMRAERAGLGLDPTAPQSDPFGIPPDPSTLTGRTFGLDAFALPGGGYGYGVSNDTDFGINATPSEGNPGGGGTGTGNTGTGGTTGGTTGGGGPTGDAATSGESRGGTVKDDGPRNDRRGMGTDTVNTWLTPGEEIVNAKSAAKYRQLIKAINDDDPVKIMGFLAAVARQIMAAKKKPKRKAA